MIPTETLIGDCINIAKPVATANTGMLAKVSLLGSGTTAPTW